MAHEHNHIEYSDNLNKAFIIGISLNIVFVLIEVAAGLVTNSLALLTDAGHNLTDVGSLVLSLTAFKFAKIKADEKYTYGYKKTTIFASLINAVILLVAVGAILWEAVGRFNNPVEIQGFTVAIVAFVGILINSFTAYLFFKDKDKDLNIKGAYLHLFADALVSVGVVVGGIVIYYTGITWIDPVLSIIIAIVILAGTFGLLKDSIHLSLDGVPKNIHIDDVVRTAVAMDGVIGFHHIHIWAISSIETALTGHLVVSKDLTTEQINSITKELKHELEHLNIHHSTIEVETQDFKCDQENC